MDLKGFELNSNSSNLFCQKNFPNDVYKYLKQNYIGFSGSLYRS